MTLNTSALIGGLRLTWAIGQALMGRASIVAKPSPTCDFIFKHRDMLRYKQWALMPSIIPERLEYRNASDLEFRYEATVNRNGKGQKLYQSEWYPGARFKKVEGSISVYFEPIEADWISESTSEWEIEIVATLANKRKRLYKGRPTSVRSRNDG